MNGAARIAKLVRQARHALHWPAWLRAYGPAALWLSAFGVLALVGAFQALSSRMASITAIIFYFGLGYLIWRGWRHYRKPTLQDGRELVDALSETKPASTMIDRPSSISPQAAKLWAAHQRRIAENAQHLPKPSVRPQLKAADPLYLRILAPTLLVAAGLHAGARAPDMLATGFRPDFGALMGADQLTAQAWISPPSYTNTAPFVLSSEEAVSAPAGSVMTLRVEAPGNPVLKVRNEDGVSRQKLRRGPDGAFETKLDISDTLEVELHLMGKRASYLVNARTDTPPQTAFTTDPDSDDRDRVTFGWSAEDDYGVVQLQLILAPIDPRISPDLRELSGEDAVVIELPQIEPKSAQDDTAIDLTRHKWAGLEVSARLRAIDAAGQTGVSEPVTFEVPQRLFLQPLAQAAIETRLEVLRDPRDYAPRASDQAPIEVMDEGQIRHVVPARLERAPEGVKRAAHMLDGLTYSPERYFDDRALFLGFRQAHAVLNTAHDKSDADAVDGLLWAVALRAEYGSYANAAEALARARRALERALRDGASEEEIKRLMQAFREAVKNYLKAQIAEALARGDTGPPPPEDSQMVGDNDLARMLEALEDLTETGAHDQARQLLSDMANLLERMKDIQLSQGGENSDLMDGPMDEALRELGEQILNQRELNDETQRAQEQAEGQNAPGQQGPDVPGAPMPGMPGAQPGQGQGESDPSGSEQATGPGAPGEDETAQSREGENATSGSQGLESLADRQRALSERLAESLANGPAGQGGQDGEAGQEPGQQPGLSEDGEGTATSPGPGEEGEDYQERLQQAEDAQNRAADALARGDLEAARRHQDDALDALGEAASAMSQAADRRAQEEGRQNTQSNTDPLGRPSGAGDAGFGDDVAVPEERERQRARDILEELRRRAGSRGLTEDEEDYLRRLLDRF